MIEKEVKIMAAKDGTHLKTDKIFKETQSLFKAFPKFPSVV